MECGELLWQPSPERVRHTQMSAMMHSLAERFGFEPQWAEFHRWSITDRGSFWQAMFDLAGIEALAPADAAYTGDGMLTTQWFPGLKLNYAAHLLRHDGDRVAIEAEDEQGRTRRMTYRQLRTAVSQCRSALRAVGVQSGDRVAGFVPNIPEAVIAMLAAASLGAAWSSCSPDFGIGGVLDRFGQIEPKVLIAADGYTYAGKPIDSLDCVAGILQSLPSVQRVVIVPFLNDRPDLSALERARSWPDFLDGAADEDLTFEALPFDHPLFILYSSGTTGVPKCIVHGHGGTLLQHMKELMLHCDLTPQDTIFYFTTCGWMMWNWVVSALGVGSTLVLYEGNPGHPDMDHLWQLAQRTGLTVFGTSPKYLSACEKAGRSPGREHDLSKLRCILSTGSPLTVENFQYVYREIKADLQMSSICGGTDLISCFMLGNPALPVHAGEIQCLGLGMDVHAYDEHGRAVIGRKGELVCRSPFPSQPVGFWNDPDNAKYKAAYFEDFEGVWRHGDFVEITPRGGVIVFGRSDATLNPGGVRIGTAEIYRVVEAMDEVVDSIVVGNQLDDDVQVCLFVVLRPEMQLDDQLEQRICRRIASGATKRHVPHLIRQVSSVPYTISGKKVELAVAQTLCGQTVENRDALANPEALNQYINVL